MDKTKIMKAFWIVAALFLIFVPLTLIFTPIVGYFSLKAFVNSYTEKITCLTGINTYLVKAVLVVLGILFITGLTRFLSPLPTDRHRRRRLQGILILTTLYVFYSLSLYAVTRESFFEHCEHQGTYKATKWCCISSGGIKCYDRPGVDTKYGNTCVEVSPDMVIAIERVKREGFREVNPCYEDWFDGFTGKPRLWYSQYDDGKFEFYNGPFFSLRTGKKLAPVNEEIKKTWQKKIEQETANNLSPGSLEQPKYELINPPPAQITQREDSHYRPDEKIVAPEKDENKKLPLPSSPPQIAANTQAGFSPSLLNWFIGENSAGNIRSDDIVKIIEITNRGAGILVVHRVIAQSPFKVLSNNCGMEPEGKSCRVRVGFYPDLRVAREYNETLTIITENKNYTIPLSGKVTVVKRVDSYSTDHQYFNDWRNQKHQRNEAYSQSLRPSKRY